MPTEQRPREWEILNEDTIWAGKCYVVTAWPPDPLDRGERISLIEKSAYEALLKERDRYEHNAQEYSLELLYAQQENTRLKAELSAKPKWRFRDTHEYTEALEKDLLEASVSLATARALADEAIKLFEHGGWYDSDDQMECGTRLRKALGEI